MFNNKKKTRIMGIAQNNYSSTNLDEYSIADIINTGFSSDKISSNDIKNNKDVVIQYVLDQLTWVPSTEDTLSVYNFVMDCVF